MEELNQVAGERLCLTGDIAATLFGSVLAIIIALVLAFCLGYL